MKLAAIETEYRFPISRLESAENFANFRQTATFFF